MSVVDQVLGFRRFVLERLEDVNGNTGVGIVAYGVLFPTGKAVLGWKATQAVPVGATGVYDSLQAVIDIHGHGGRTVARFVDPEDAAFILSDELRTAIAGEAVAATLG